MSPGPQAPTLRILIVSVFGLALFGCGLEPRSSLLPNVPPVVTLDRPLVGADHQILFRWKASDPDGRIDHFLFATDPHSVDRVDPSWSITKDLVTTVRFPRSVAVGRASAADTPDETPHIFAVRAVDDRGAISAPAAVGMFGDSLAPFVFITSPQPNGAFVPIVPTSVTIQWRGIDVDGQIAKFKYRLFAAQNPDFPGIIDFISYAIANPDTLRSFYGPTFATWDSVGANVTSATYTGLVPNQLYLFVVTAVDRAGHYDPVFSTSANMLKFAVSDQIGQPFLCVSSPIFNFCPDVGSDYGLQYEISAGAPLPVTWVGFPEQGLNLDGYRWAIDPSDTTGALDREHVNSDPNHWSAWSPTATSATLGPYPASDAGNLHVLYIQARDEVDHVSTVKVRVTVTQPTRDRDILVVDDTRLTPDNRDAFGTLRPPIGPWPTAAELDTFLYARGGFPWQGYPAGTLSPPGLMNGYDFDTLGTRGLPGGVVPLSVLSRYRHVMWFTDDVGATYTGSPSDLLAPITSLRLMSAPGAYNSLAAYVAAGGSLWLSGGGAAYATQVYWNKRNTPSDDWTNIDNELISGRFMYDFPHWRSAVAVRPARQALLNTPDFAPWPNAALGRGWSAQGMDRSLSQPSYARLAGMQIQVLNPRSCPTDPPSPLRVCNSFFLVDSYQAEYIGRVPPFAAFPNQVLEDADPRPNHERLVSTLDTLYLASGGSMPGPSPVMTYYHGFETGPVVFSGFPIWQFHRAQGQGLVDFVLQDVWGLSRRTGPASVAVASRRR